MVLLGLVVALGMPTAAHGTPHHGAGHHGAGHHGTGHHGTGHHGAERHLLVADPTAGRIDVHRLPDMQRTGSLEDVALGAHAGTVVLPDGRVLFVDDAGAQVVVLTIDRHGAPVVLARVDIPGDREWEGVTWAGVDPAANYFAVTSGYEDSAEQTVTVVDLFDYGVGQLPVTLTADAEGGYEELHTWLAGQPLQVAVTTGGQLRTYPLAEVMTGRVPEPTSTVPAGPNPHGPVLSRDGDRLFVTTTEGVDRVRVVGGELVDRVTLPYPEPPPLVQDYRPRLSQDGRTLYGPIAQDEGLAPEQWADTTHWLHLLDTGSEETTVEPLTDGIVGRSAQSRASAVFPVVGGDGDAALLVDVDASSPTFGQTEQRVPLEPLTQGPQPGISSADTERRSAAVTYEGDLAFVSHGGDGLVSVVDTERGEVTDTVRTSTPLSGGGYLVTVEKGVPLVDVLAR